MKRFGILALSIIITTISFGSFVKAQFTDPTKTNLGDVLIRFCNNVGTGANTQAPTKKLKLETKTGDKKDICLYIQNSGPTDTTVKLNFVDGTITADDSQNKACQPEETKENFGQYVIFSDKEKVFDVPAGSRVEKHAQIQFPEGYAGMSYGCATLQIEGESLTKTDGMFNILSRRGNFIDVLVHGEIIPHLEIIQQKKLFFPNLGNNNQLVVYQDPDTKSYMAKVVFKNSGNVAQLIEIEPTAASWFHKNIQGRFQDNKEIIEVEGEDKVINNSKFIREKSNSGKAIERKVLPNNEIAITFPIDAVIPFFQGEMNLDIKVKSTPIVDFETKNTESLKTTTTLLHTSFFLIPRNLIIIICIVLVLLRLLFTARKKSNIKNKEKQKNK